jgi:hypothetical protein
MRELMKIDVATSAQLRDLERRLLRRIEELEAMIDASMASSKQASTEAWQKADAALYVANLPSRR